MPIRPQDLLREPPTMIAEDRACRFCGYNLRGLNDAGICPECGKPVRKPRDLSRYADQMSNAPVAWLRGYQLGTLLLCAGAWALTPSVVGWALFDHIGFELAAFAASGVWTAGTFIATRPRPRTAATMINPDTEWRVLRAWARWSQPAWTLALAGVLLERLSGYVGVATTVPIAILMLTGVVGWWPLLMLQANLAYWASDTDLSDRLRTSAWVIAPALGIALVMLWVTGTGWSGFLMGFVMVSFFWVGLIIVSLGYLLITLTKLWRMGHWAMVNHMTSEIKDDRLREQVRKASAAMNGPR